jgi:hypothetical protein
MHGRFVILPNASLVSQVFPRMKERPMLVLTGLPGAGKTMYFRKVLQPLGYNRINQHDLGNFRECVRMCEEYLSKGKLVCYCSTLLLPVYVGELTGTGGHRFYIKIGYIGN